MDQLRRVLAATDLSSAARHAAGRAALVCTEAGAALDLFHAFNLSGVNMLRRLVPGFPNGLEQRVIDERREEISHLGSSLMERYGIAAGVHLSTGHPFPEIERCAAALSADLVVLGAHGLSALVHPILGATAARMAERSELPVLVVKRPPREPYRNVLVPVDFSAYSLPALRTACAVAPGCNILLMHAYGVPFEGKLRAALDVDEALAPLLAVAGKKVFENLRELCDAAELTPRAARLLACHGTALDQILEQEQHRRCDLIVVGRHGEAPLLERLFVGSVTRQVLAQSQADVLVSAAE